MERRLLCVAELAEYLAVSKDFVYSLTYRKQIPFVKIGRAVRFNKAAIDRWLEKSSVEADGWGR